MQQILTFPKVLVVHLYEQSLCSQEAYLLLGERNIGKYKQVVYNISSVQFSSVQSLSRVRLLATPWIIGCQASLSITIFQSSLKLMSIESVMPSSYLILCHPLFLLPPIPPSIRVFSNESTLIINSKYRVRILGCTLVEVLDFQLSYYKS